MNGLELKNLRKNLGFSQDALAQKLNVTRRTIINWEKSEKIDDNNVKLIRIALNDEKDTILRDPNATLLNYNGFMLVPLVGVRAQAGFLSGYGDTEYLEELPKVPFEVDREYKGRYLCFEVAGDSMDNNSPESILEGDILLCREIQQHHWTNQLHINKWDFVIVHRDNGILVKRIKNHNTEKSVLTLHSLNEFYEDFEVDMNDVVAIFNVVDIKRSRKRR